MFLFLPAQVQPVPPADPNLDNEPDNEPHTADVVPVPLGDKEVTQ